MNTNVSVTTNVTVGEEAARVSGTMPEEMKRRIFLGIRKKRQDDALKVPLLNLELYLLARIPMEEDNLEVILDQSFLAVSGMSEEELFRLASANTKDNLVIRSLREVVMSLLGEEDQDPGEDEVPMYVCTTHTKTYGAAALATPEVFQQFCRKKGLADLYILPSSIHEVIMLPANTIAVKDLVHLVDEVNRTEVADADQLLPAVYHYSTKTNQITIATTL